MRADCQTRAEPTYGAYIQNKEVLVLGYLFAILVVAALVYIGWRLMRVGAGRPRTRTIGPDDDPDFLRRLGHEDPRQ